MAQRAKPVGEPDLPFVATGYARLPKSVAADAALSLELVLDAAGTVTDVSASTGLPGHAGLLRRLLGGRALEDLEEAAGCLPANYSGPLLRPTLAAIGSAIVSARDLLRQEKEAGNSLLHDASPTV